MDNIKEVFETFLKKDYVTAEQKLKDILQEKKKEYLQYELGLEEENCEDCKNKEDDDKKDNEEEE